MFKRFKWALVVAVTVGAAFAGWTFRQASRALHSSAAQVAAAGEIRFDSLRLNQPVPAGYELISAPPEISDEKVFQGCRYQLSQNVLLGCNGARYRAGLELPPARLVAMATEGEQQLLIATTGEGLLAFDGRAFQQVRPLDPAYRSVTAILPLASGRILIGTEKRGLLTYDGKRLAPFHSTLSTIHVTALAGGESGIWIGTLDQGLLYWHAGQVDRVGESDGLPDRQVLALAAEGDSTYAATPLGIAEFYGARFKRTIAPGVLARSLKIQGETLVAGTLEDGVVTISLKGGAPRFSNPAAAERGSNITDNNISALAVDASGRLWIGYFDRGLDIVEANGRVRHIEDDRVYCVNRIVHDPERGITAVATANGLVMIDGAGTERQVLGRAAGLIADHVTDVVRQPGGLAVATPAGITILDGAGTRSLYAFHGLVNNHVYALGASGGRLLAGTLGGLSILEGGVVRAGYTTANSPLKHNWITAVAPVAEEWFVGTYGAGVVRLDSAGRWESFLDSMGDTEINSNAMAVTDTNVYAGTLRRGLLVYDRAAARWKAKLGGLPSANVTAIAAHNGTIYVGTDNGLVRIPE